VSSDRPPPLEGIRVLDLTRVFSGPLCGRILADLGAEVVKVEPPEGDIVRTTPPVIDGTSVMYAHMNAGKRNVCVDLKAEGGAALLARLAEKCDVVLENYRPGVMARLGLGSRSLLERNPRLIYCSVTGWGQTGPEAQRAAYAPLIHAQMGGMELAARLRRAPIQQELHQHGDLYAGLAAAGAITTALFQRERTGRGQHVDVSMAEVLLYMNEHTGIDLAGYEGERDFDTWTFFTVELGDGTLANLIGNPKRLFHAYVALLGGDDVSGDPRFATPEAVDAHLSDAHALLDELAGRVADMAELEKRMEDMPLMVAEIRTLADAARSAWARDRGVIAEVEPGLEVPAAPWRSAHASIGTRGSAPRRGAHNHDVLASWVGLAPDEIQQLEACGALLADDEKEGT
jgi:crotonobetainyl-CoA:carnitine CoA-transferase CaiB-like acyl-CoA transferase